MKLIIDSNILREYDFTLEEFLLLLLNLNEKDIGKCKDTLIEKELVSEDLFDENKLVLSDEAKALILDILEKSTAVSDTLDFTDLANKLREIYPKGRKPGTTYMWRDSAAIIARKLRTLRIKYKFKFTEEQALNATRAYVNSFNGDYKYMQLLKYFILKTLTNNNGDTEVKSEFMSYIENEGFEDNDTDEDWATTLA